MMVAHQGAVSCLSFDPSGLYMVSSGHDRSLRVWDVATKTCNWERPRHMPLRDEVRAALCSACDVAPGDAVACGTRFGTFDKLFPHLLLSCVLLSLIAPRSLSLSLSLFLCWVLPPVVSRQSTTSSSTLPCLILPVPVRILR